MMKTGVKETGENWRDNYRTPENILSRVDELWPGEWFDPCPKNPSFDGLEMAWKPPTFVNPPFSKYAKWLNHGLNQTNEQIWICHNNTDSKWFQELLANSTAVLFTNHRVHFIDPRTGKPAKDTRQGQALFYRGFYSNDFKEIFEDLGFFIELEK